MNYARMERLIHDAIFKFDLDLSGLNIFTEAASGNYIVSPLIAAVAGASFVWAITRDSKYSMADDVEKSTLLLAEKLGVFDNIKIVRQKQPDILKQCDIITNTGFVRPIDKGVIDNLKPTAVIPLMWETWEYRKADIDIKECKRKGIVVLGTNEHDQRLNTFNYVGFIALKLLLLSDIEVFGSNILVIGGGYFGNSVIKAITANMASTKHITFKSKELEKPSSDELTDLLTDDYIRSLDAIVICEHEINDIIIGRDGLLPPKRLSELNPGISVVHICGNVCEEDLIDNNINYIPKMISKFGYMSISTDFVGMKPIVDLHTAGLKVGEVMSRARRRKKSVDDTIEFAINNSPAMKFDISVW